MKLINALLSGAAGAAFLTVVHESVRQFAPTAPRVDILGRRLIKRAFHQTGNPAPASGTEYALALTGDLLSNTLYYSLVGLGDPETANVRGRLLGVGAGLAALTLPERLNLPEEPVSRHLSTKLMTVAWYTLGGMVAGRMAQRFGEEED